MYEVKLAAEHVQANAHVYDGFDEGHDGRDDYDAAWSPGDCDHT
ncbi:unnamed protein product [marine sediment metagenome]|uniref:Uncharacterized protein n=1 Tax=marine sediment metagenome TaxID=412755 RepID=X0U9Z6_9ZZZZ